MTGENTGPPAGARGGSGDSVTALHGEWLRIQNRLTGLRLFEATARQAGAPARGAEAASARRRPVGHEPPLTKPRRMALVEEARALERRIALTRAEDTAEVILKLKLSACPLLLTGDWRALVDSAARFARAKASILLSSPPRGTAFTPLLSFVPPAQAPSPARSALTRGSRQPLPHLAAMER